MQNIVKCVSYIEKRGVINPLVYQIQSQSITAAFPIHRNKMTENPKYVTLNKDSTSVCQVGA